MISQKYSEWAIIWLNSTYTKSSVCTKEKTYKLTDVSHFHWNIYSRGIAAWINNYTHTQTHRYTYKYMCVCTPGFTWFYHPSNHKISIIHWNSKIQKMSRIYVLFFRFIPLKKMHFIFYGIIVCLRIQIKWKLAKARIGNVLMTNSSSLVFKMVISSKANVY